MIETLQALLLRVIDPWIPAKAKASGTGLFIYRFLVSILLGTFLYLSALLLINQYLLPLTSQGKQLITEFSLGMAAGISCALLVLRSGAKRSIALHIFIAALTVGLVNVSMQTGGIGSPVNICSVIIPALATLSIGASAGVFWSLLIALIGSLMFAAEFQGYVFRDIITAQNQGLALFACLLTTHSFIIFIVVYYDINGRKLRNQLLREQQKYFHQARQDSLTGLANRRFFIEAIENTIQNAKRNNSRFSVLYFDLNHFKSANDRYGHHFGDEILVRVANRITAEIRDNDVAARLGGDEFAVLLPSLGNPDTVERRIRQLVELLSKPLVIDGIDYQPSASAGFAMFPEHGTEYESLLKAADHSMYQVKRLNRRSTAQPEATAHISTS